MDLLVTERLQAMDGRASKLLESWPDQVKAYSGDQKVDTLSNGKQITTQLNTLSLSGNKIPRVSLPRCFT